MVRFKADLQKEARLLRDFRDKFFHRYLLQTLSIAIVLSIAFPLAAGAMEECTPKLALGETDWKRGKLYYLAPYIGTDKAGVIIKDPIIAKALKDLSGKESAQLIRDNLFVHSPVNFIDGDIVITGNAAHQGRTERAILVVTLHSGEVRAGLLHEGKVILYAREKNYSFLPSALHEFAENSLLDHRNAQELPHGVVWGDQQKE